MKVRSPKYGVVPVSILTDPRITFSDLKVYTALASFQGSNDDAYPSRVAIVERCGLVVETVSRSVVHLVKLGWLQRDRRPNASSIYRVMVELDSITEVTPKSFPGSDPQVMPEVTPKSFPSIKQKEHLKVFAKKGNDTKRKHGEYSHVRLTDSELEKIKAAFPLDWSRRIVEMDEGVELHGYKYKSHYLAILKWAKMEQSKSTPLYHSKAEADDSWRFNDPLSGKLL